MYSGKEVKVWVEVLPRHTVDQPVNGQYETACGRMGATNLRVLIVKVLNHAISAINNVAVSAFCLTQMLLV